MYLPLTAFHRGANLKVVDVSRWNYNDRSGDAFGRAGGRLKAGTYFLPPAAALSADTALSTNKIFNAKSSHFGDRELLTFMSQNQEDVNSQEPSEDALLNWLIRGADELRKRLNISERDFNMLSRAHNSRGRGHFIYATLDEIEQVAFALKLTQDSFAEPPADNSSDELWRRITRNTYTAIESEQSLQIRRLTEVLVSIINFSQTNADEYYDHYLLYKELEQRQKKKADYAKYFKCENLNNLSAITFLKASITRAESKLGLNKCWYLQGKNPAANGEAKIASFKDYFNSALPIATKAERFALGFSYAYSYGETSQSIHLNIGGFKSRRSFEMLKSRRGQIWYLAIHCLNRCRRLLNIRSQKDIGADISRVLNQSLTSDFYRRLTQPNIAKGDFVSVFDSLCEVIGSAKSEFGYKSFKVRYLTRPPIPDQKEDWFPAINVRKQLDGKDLRDDVLKLLQLPDGRQAKLNPKILRKILRENAIKLWEELLAATRRN